MPRIKSSLVCLLVLMVMSGGTTDVIYLDPTCFPQVFFLDITTTLLTIIPSTITSYTLPTHTPTFTLTGTVIFQPLVTRWKQVTVTPEPQLVTTTSYVSVQSHYAVNSTVTSISVAKTVVTVVHTKLDSEDFIPTVTSVTTLTKTVEVPQSPLTVTVTLTMTQQMTQEFTVLGEAASLQIEYPPTATITTCSA